MAGFWSGLWESIRVAMAALYGFFMGDLLAEHDQLMANEKQKVKELKTDAKNREDVGRLSDDELDAELRNPPRL